MSDFEVFRAFYDREEAEAMAALLKEKDITSKIQKEQPVADKIFIGHSGQADIFLMISSADFSKANSIINDHIRNNLTSLDPDYYLHSFSNEELNDILKKPYEWSNQDVIIAQNILSKRGIIISDHETEQLKLERLKQLAKPHKKKFWGLFWGYVMAVFLPFYGFFIALFQLTSKKILPDGTKIYVYDRSTRDHFTAMIIIASFIIAGAIFGVTGVGWVPGMTGYF